MVAITTIALVLQQGMNLGNFLSNSKSKDMAEMEDIGKVERETTSSKVKETMLEKK